jgi:hypothetical protein
MEWQVDSQCKVSADAHPVCDRPTMLTPVCVCASVTACVCVYIYIYMLPFMP